MRDQVRSGHVEVIVADKVDRFSRADPAITAYVMVEAEQYGCQVEFVEIQDDSFEGQILRAVLSIVARVEHKRIKERLNAGKRRRVVGDPAKGKPPRLLPGNVPRYGWKYRDEAKSAYDIEPHQAAVVRRIYHEVGELGSSLASVCRQLMNEHEPPPTEAQARSGYAIGHRKASMLWSPSSVARMLKQPCYWGEPSANRYEFFLRELRDPRTNRIRRQKRTRYRDPDSDRIIPYSIEIWPPIVSKGLAMKALAQLKRNQEEAERNLKHVGLSFLRAGHIICGYCGSNMVMHSHKVHKDDDIVIRFICGRHRSFKQRRNMEDCPSGGQFSVRCSEVEAAVWEYLITALSDPRIVPEAYERLHSRRQEIETHRQRRIQALDTLIREASTRRSNFLVAVGQVGDDQEVRKGLLKLATEETSNIRTWQAERDRIEQEADARDGELASVRSIISQINSSVVHMLRASVPKRRKVVQALGVRVMVYRLDHDPWFALMSDLPGLTASWQAKRRKHAAVMPIRTVTPSPAHVVGSEAIHKWTAVTAPHEQETQTAASVERQEPVSVG